MQSKHQHRISLLLKKHPLIVSRMNKLSCLHLTIKRMGASVPFYNGYLSAFVSCIFLPYLFGFCLFHQRFKELCPTCQKLLSSITNTSSSCITSMKEPSFPPREPPYAFGCYLELAGVFFSSFLLILVR